MNQLDHVARAIARSEENVTADHGRDESRHCLAEHVAERKQIQKADGAERTDIFAVFFDAFIDRLQIRQNVAMRNRYALRVTGRAGGEEDLGKFGRGCRIE